MLTKMADICCYGADTLQSKLDAILELLAHAFNVMYYFLLVTLSLAPQ